MNKKQIEDIYIEFNSFLGNSTKPIEIKEEVKDFWEIWKMNLKSLPASFSDLNKEQKEIVISNKIPFEDIWNKLETDRKIIVKEGVAINAEESDYWYTDKKRELSREYGYSKTFYKYLRKKDIIKTNVIRNLDNDSDKLMNFLKDPQDSNKNEFSVKGMIIGQVQSGKTLNYTALVNKAIDAGYKNIFIIAGLSNLLRSQTQERIELYSTGRSTKDGNTLTVGVGGLRKKNNSNMFTTISNDFDTKKARGLDVPVEDVNTFFIIKKNVTVLKNLIHYLNRYKDNLPPALIIDDEADYASIDTNYNDPDKDPTATNKQIRKLIKLYKKSAYISVTATPFANIFIDPDTMNDMFGDDLFPKDFIYALDQPTNYQSANRIFNEKNNIYNEIYDHKDYIPQNHKSEDNIEVPPSLLRSLNQFLISHTIRFISGKPFHSSMLINVSPYNWPQCQIRQEISYEFEKIRNSIELHSLVNKNSTLEHESIKNLRNVFEEDFSKIPEIMRDGIQWDSVKKMLYESIKNIKVVELNGHKDCMHSVTTLEYDTPNDDNQQHLIIVGGYSLSRGMTLEGLINSYYLRNTSAADTLLQMGRWFGYRDGYDYLCKVWMTNQSKERFISVHDTILELSQEIEIMHKEKKTPKDFGLRVRCHDEGLKLRVTAKQKEGTAKEVYYDDKTRFSGSVRYTNFLINDDEVVENHHKILKKTLSNIEKSQENLDRYYKYSNIFREELRDFFQGFKHHEKNISTKHLYEFIYSDLEKMNHFDIIIPKNGQATEKQKKKIKEIYKSGFGVGERKNAITEPNEKEKVIEIPNRSILSSEQRKFAWDFVKLPHNINRNTKKDSEIFNYIDRPILYILFINEKDKNYIPRIAWTVFIPRMETTSSYLENKPAQGSFWVEDDEQED
tara:strand:+ start:2884 stop:5580 length:2697 start_codon:yes stop_codon:yes gene_type:complete